MKHIEQSMLMKKFSYHAKEKSLEDTKMQTQYKITDIFTHKNCKYEGKQELQVTQVLWNPEALPKYSQIFYFWLPMFAKYISGASLHNTLP